MKTHLVIAGAALVLASSIHAQDLIAGFDLSGTSANYSDLGNGGAVNDGAPANAYGSIAITDGAGNPFAVTQFGSNNSITAGTVLNSSIRVLGFNDEIATIGGSIQAEDLGFASADGGFIDVTVTPGSAFNNYSFGFAAGQTQAGTSSLAFSADFGSGFQSLGNDTVTALASAGGQAYTIDASSLGSASTAIFRITFTDITAGVLFDNFQVSGTVVPEPSSFAFIAGALAMVFVARRRK